MDHFINLDVLVKTANRNRLLPAEWKKMLVKKSSIVENTFTHNSSNFLNKIEKLHELLKSGAVTQ